MSASATSEASVAPAVGESRRQAGGAPGDAPHVIYVMGAGRSGSTTLGIALGNCAGVFYAGELDNWLVRSGVPQVEDPERERFWSSVREQLEDLGAASALFGNEAQRAIERSVSLFRIHKWPARYRLRRRYRAVAEDLYRATARAGGVTHVVDTSHYPLRALELQHLGGVNLYLVFLLRDPQGVVASFNRHDVREYTKSTLQTNVYLWLTHLLSLFVFLRHRRDRRLFVRYEEFIADPGGVVRRILDTSGCSTVSLPDFTSLDVGLPLQGNRVTRTEKLSLKESADSPSSPSFVTSVLQAPLLAMLSRLRPTA
jgi:Sulfotransferase family